jgi:hypothetical protein
MLPRLRKYVARWVIVGITLIFLLSTPSVQNTHITGIPGAKIALAEASETIASGQSDATIPMFLPITWKFYPWSNPFGFEIMQRIDSHSLLLDRAISIPAKWARLNHRISWRQLQPNEGDPIQWDLLAIVDDELRAFQGVDITPIMIVMEYPAWATATRPGGEPSYCGPMLSDKFQAFANFMSQIVNRYKAREFNVHIWELGNEPDVDGEQTGLSPESEFGCWGDAEDPYYGGRHYGEMLKVVTPAIKAADPQAQVWLGGLLLDSPLTTAPGNGRPELFLQGILEAGIGTDYSYFDVVPYHTYTNYRTKVNAQEFDYDNDNELSPWYGGTWGGAILGKAKFLRQTMNAYGVQKPLFVNEISLTCVSEWNPALCDPLSEGYLQAEANHLVRVEVRGLSEEIMGFTWYTLDGPGWRNGSLLFTNGDPRPSYLAYQQLAHQLFMLNYLAPLDYGPAFEAYAFGRAGQTQEVHVVWSKEDLLDLTILVPASKFVEARSRDGTMIAPVLVGDNYQIPVGFSPVYVIRRP